MSARLRSLPAAALATAIVGLVAGCSGGATTDPATSANQGSAPEPAAVRPSAGTPDGGTAQLARRAAPLRIRKWLIPYGRKRKRDMARYSKRHYGRFRWRLRDPKLIVEHYAVAGSVRAIHDTFAPNRPDVEFHELPGVCAHFAVSASGAVYKFVPTSIRCRHVVGLNHVAIGIEHVGFSDAEILGRKRQLRASLRLTRQLRCRFGIPVHDVIGHNESLSSRFYKELDPDFRGQTHGDWTHAHMRVYRAKLRRLGGC